ncbi:uncharacterized, partial [Tachysurus ichikawai]
VTAGEKASAGSVSSVKSRAAQFNEAQREGQLNVSYTTHRCGSYTIAAG